MNVRKISNNHYVAVIARSLTVYIKMNPRDAMVFARVLLFPSENQELVITELETFLKEKVGGKILLQLPLHATEQLGEAKYMPSVKFISPENIRRALTIFNAKTKIQAIHNQANQIGSNICLLHHSQNFNKRFAKLFAFKKDNADFVTEQKIKNGLYSALAEKEKITKNKFAKHFAFYDNYAREFIACIQIVVHDEMGYLSDLIVGKTHRNKGYAQTLLSYALQHLSQGFNDYETLKGAWLIEDTHDAHDPLIPFIIIYTMNY